MSATQTPHTAPATKSPEQELLYDLRKRIVAWRMRTGKSVYWMPKPLWQEALTAAELCGLERTAKYLRIDCVDLKNRLRLVEAAPAAAAAEEFIELPGVAQPLPPEDPHAPQAIDARERTEKGVPAKAPDAPPAINVSAAEALIELRGADGAHLSVRLPLERFDLHALLHQFRSHP